MKKISLVAMTYLIAFSIVSLEANNMVNYYLKKVTDTVFPKTVPIVNQIALISIEKSLESAKAIIKTLLEVRDNQKIKGIIIHMNCRGGSPATAQAILSELKKLKKIKPVIVIVENDCTSGAYYIACCSDFIFAQPSSSLGSIGVVTTIETCKDLKFHEDKMSGKVETLVFTNGKYKYPSRYVTPDDDLMESLKNNSRKTYEQFVHDVAQMRNLSTDNEKIWADGRAMTGIEALELGLIDAIGDFSDAVEKIKEILNRRGFSSPKPLELVNIGSF